MERSEGAREPAAGHAAAGSGDGEVGLFLKMMLFITAFAQFLARSSERSMTAFAHRILGYERLFDSPSCCSSGWVSSG